MELKDLDVTRLSFITFLSKYLQTRLWMFEMKEVELVALDLFCSDHENKPSSIL